MLRGRLVELASRHGWLVAVVLGGFVGTAGFFGPAATSIRAPSQRLISLKAMTLVNAPQVGPFDAIVPQTFEPLSPAQAVESNGQIPFSALPNPPAQPFSLAGANQTDRSRARTCLALAVYYEARSQGPDGEAAVAQVVLNRLRHPLFPKSVCGVVFQGSGQETGCQFTFTCDGSMARAPSPAGWKDALEVAERALDGRVESAVGEATHYHTVWVAPYWRSSVVKLTQIGAHIFYRWPGPLGGPAAFTVAYAGSEQLPPVRSGVDATPPQIQVADLQVKPPEVVSAPVISPAAPDTPPSGLVQVALLDLELPTSLADSDPTPAKRGPNDFFGGGNRYVHRLPVPTRW